MQPFGCMSRFESMRRIGERGLWRHNDLYVGVSRGAKRLDQLHDNLAAADLKLTPDELAKLDEVSALPPEYPGWMAPFQNRDRLENVPRS